MPRWFFQYVQRDVGVGVFHNYNQSESKTESRIIITRVKLTGFVRFNIWEHGVICYHQEDICTGANKAVNKKTPLIHQWNESTVVMWTFPVLGKKILTFYTDTSQLKWVCFPNYCKTCRSFSFLHKRESVFCPVCGPETDSVGFREVISDLSADVRFM